MTLRKRAKVLLHVYSYDFYDTTLSTEKQHRHMINVNSKFNRVYCTLMRRKEVAPMKAEETMYL